jgi:hypothetical protein
MIITGLVTTRDKGRATISIMSFLAIPHNYIPSSQAQQKAISKISILLSPTLQERSAKKVKLDTYQRKLVIISGCSLLVRYDSS